MIAEVIVGVDGECFLCAARACCELDRRMPWIDWFDLVATSSGRWSADMLRAESPCQEKDATT